MEDIYVVEGGEQFHADSVALMDFYMRIIDEDYREILEVYFDENLTASDAENFGVLLKNLEEQEEVFFSAFSESQKEFAELKSFSL